MALGGEACWGRSAARGAFIIAGCKIIGCLRRAGALGLANVWSNIIRLRGFNEVEHGGKDSGIKLSGVKLGGLKGGGRGGRKGGEEREEGHLHYTCMRVCL